MSIADEMGLTYEAASGYEDYFVPAIFHQWPEKMLAAAGVAPDHNVLDVGCGTGVLTRSVASRLDATGRVTGIDLSENMLKVASEMCSDAVFRFGNAMELPFASASFDVVFSAFMLMFVPDRVKAISEMRRVLRPGGCLVVSVWQGLADNPIYDALVNAARDMVDDAAAESLAWPFALGQGNKFKEMFSAAGLESVVIEAHDGFAQFPSVEEFVNTEIQSWLLADTISTTQIDAIRTRLCERYPSLAGATNPISFPLNALIAKIEYQSFMEGNK